MGLFGGGTKTVTNTTEIPPWLKGYVTDNLARADQVASAPYVGYGGDRLAPLSSNQQHAITSARQNAGSFRDPLEEALGIQSGLATAGPTDVTPYLNPYGDQVLDRAIGRVRSETDERRAQLDRSYAAAGAFGDARHGVAQGQLYQGETDAIADMTARLMAEGYDTAFNQALADQSMQLRAAGDLTRTAGLEQQFAQNDLASLLQTGAVDQEQVQRGLDVDYLDFAERRDHDQNMASFMASILSGTPHGHTQTGQVPKRGALGDIAAVAGLGLKLFSAF